MKVTQILFLQLLLSLNLLFASSTNPVWFYTQHSVDGNSSYVAKFTGDTVISNVSYRVLHNFHVTIPGLFTNPWQIGDFKVYLRYDSIAEIVYVKHSLQPEQVLYDYSMQLGDTLNNYTVLSTIDTVQLQDLSYRTRFIFRGTNNDSIVWIKWIGNLAHPLYSYYPFGSDFLFCYHEQSTLVYEYQNLVPVQCNLYTNINDSPVSPEIILFPNPFWDRFEVNSVKPIREVQLVNQLGQSFSYILSGDSNATLDLTSFHSGLIFVNIIFDDGSTCTSKIQKLNTK